MIARRQINAATPPLFVTVALAYVRRYLKLAGDKDD